MTLFDTLAGMSAEELRVLLAILTSGCALTGYLFFLFGKARGWHDQVNAIGRDHVVVESAIFRDRPDGMIEVAIETADRMPHLSEVFCNSALEKKVRGQVAKCAAGEPLFPPGPDHYIAMERVGLLMTGADTIATQAALLGRHEDYHVDRVAVMLTAARGEDGLHMPRIIKVDPAQLIRLGDPGYVSRLVPLRQVHQSYVPLLVGMAKNYAAAQTIFQSETDECTAGRKAPVWTAFIRSQRTALTEAQIRRIVRDEMREGVRAA